MGSFCSTPDRKTTVVMMVTPREESAVQMVTGDSLHSNKAALWLQHPIRSRCSNRRRVHGLNNYWTVTDAKNCRYHGYRVFTADQG
ncbi:hypothetical protein JOB18_023122 [Solea senegalensis]|uniref:Uncharacterized protein n=1 Tax=Solea senegalensis TaxID=28829 RepID=A0AAV6PB45_SOLSE|nr:hypothetical protein JOB18_023122 [Solea senegalensis]